MKTLGGGGGGSAIVSILSLLFPISHGAVSSPTAAAAAPTGTLLVNTPPTTTSRVTTTTTSVFSRNLRPGDRGADVRALQVFLNTQGFIVAKSGLGSPGDETTIFGAATAKAVTKFQEVYKETILKPYNLTKGTGIFGVKMREVVGSLR